MNALEEGTTLTLDFDKLLAVASRDLHVLPVVLQELDFVAALGIVEQREMWDAIQRRTNSVVPPGTQLHVLAIGVGDYNEEWAKHLRLEFADDDALDVASALFNTQGSLYPRSTRKSCATGRPPAPASSAPSAPFRRRCRG